MGPGIHTRLPSSAHQSTQSAGKPALTLNHSQPHLYCTAVRLALPRYNGAGRELVAVSVYFLSDSYLGLDQEYEVVSDLMCGAREVRLVGMTPP